MKIPAVVMRGGTSKALFFHESDLPTDPDERDAVILATYGSPDPFRLQMDGMGGATSLTSKVAVIGSDSQHKGSITYTFGQVAIDRPLIDRRGNCGNISAAVGPFAIDEHLVDAIEPITKVRFINANTSTTIVAHVPVRNHRFDPRGSLRLPGVPTPGAPIQIDYLDPGGAVTGALLPTGSTSDVIDIPGIGEIEVSIVDAANPVAFVRWEAFGLTGLETPADVDSNPELLARLEMVRTACGVLAGISATPEDCTRFSPSIPKLALVGEPRGYRLADGHDVRAEHITLRMMMMSMGRAHTSIALTGAACTAVAAGIPGTLVATASRHLSKPGVARIGHMAGVMSMEAHPRATGPGQWKIDTVSTVRTARRLMEGSVFVELESFGDVRREGAAEIG